MEIVCIIPARGGSKGIPRKNIRPVLGRPLLAYTIEHARRTAAIARVIVSTDDSEIATVAQEYGAAVVRRPADISGDTASSESALLHVLDCLRESEGYEPDLVVFLQVTSPLRQPNDIQNAINAFERANADSLFSAGRVHGFVWRQEGESLTSFNYDYRNRKRRQEIGVEDLIENGSIYIFKPWVLRELGNRLGGKVVAFRMGALESLQIDEPADLEIMEQLLATRQGSQRTGSDLSGIQLLVLDFDGVMTDNGVLVSEDGKESVYCHRGDGWGIARLKEADVEVVVLSTETNPVVAARCRKLGIECVQGCNDKLEALRHLVERRSLDLEQVAYVGNDANDLDCLAAAGVSIAVADALPQVRERCRVVTALPGGHGAVREVCDLIISQRKGHVHG